VWHVFPADALARRGQGCFPATLRTWDQTMWLCRDISSQSAWPVAPLLPLGFSCCASRESRGNKQYLPVSLANAHFGVFAMPVGDPSR
jgi:hypothetical protein